MRRRRVDRPLDKLGEDYAPACLGDAVKEDEWQDSEENEQQSEGGMGQSEGR